MKKLMLAALLAASMPAMADYKPSPELQKCMQEHISAGNMEFDCPKTAEQRMKEAYKKLEQTLQTPEQRAALAAEQQAWRNWQAAKDGLTATYAAKRGGNLDLIERTEYLERTLRVYKQITESRNKRD